MALYLKHRLWEIFFCVVASAALVFTSFSAFYATQPLQAFPIFAAVAVSCGVLTLVLYLIAYSRSTALWGSIVLAAAVVIAVAICTVAGTGESPVDDVEGNYAIASILVALLTVLVFLLSRRRGLAIAMLLAGVLLCALIEYFFWYNHFVALVLFVLASIALIVFKGYQHTLEHSDSDKLAFGPVSMAAVVLVIVALLCGTGVFYIIIAPLNPPHQVVKLFTEYRRANEIYYTSTGSSDAASGGLGGNEGNSDLQESNVQTEEQLSDVTQNLISSMLGMSTDQQGDAGQTNAIVDPSYLVLIVIAAVILLIVLAILLKKYLRRRRYAKMTAGSNEETVSNLYLFYLGQLQKLRIPRPKTSSLAEYASNNRLALSTFEQAEPGQHAEFEELTGTYMRVAYGRQSVSDEERGAFERYYDSWYRNVSNHLGRLRYVLRFFRL